MPDHIPTRAEIDHASQGGSANPFSLAMARLDEIERLLRYARPWVNADARNGNASAKDCDRQIGNLLGEPPVE